MKKILLLILLLSLLAGCTTPPATEPTALPTQPPPTASAMPEPTLAPPPTAAPTPTVAPTLAKPGALLQSQVQRDLAPQVEAADQAELVRGNLAFAIDFYRAERSPDSDLLFFSPLSLSLALAMTYAGARGETEAQMAQTLHFTLPQERLHPAFNSLSLQLAAAQEAMQDELQPFQLSIANSLWGERTYAFLPAFLDVIARNYGAGLRLVDFAGASGASRKRINDWVYQETQERIADLIPPGAITPQTTLVLANAIYFQADWLHPFAARLTQEQPFTTLAGGQVSIPMMNMPQAVELNYAAGEGFQAVELPYAGGRAAMIVLLPDEGNFTGFEDALSAEKLIEIREMMQPAPVMLSMPKFSFQQQFELAETLRDMGMAAAFEPGRADFSGMDGSKLLSISDVFHQAFVAVDEKGTEAAAATAVVIFRSGFSQPPVEMRVDRPFIFLIQDNTTGSVLFLGCIVDPSFLTTNW